MAAEIEAIRERGYAEEREQYEAGVGCVGVPVLDDDGHALAAISVSATLVRLERLDLDDLVAFVRDRASRLARELGSRTVG